MKNRSAVILAAFFFSLHLALVSYVNSSLLGLHYSKNIVSLLYIAGSVVSCMFLARVPLLTKRFGAINTISLCLGLAAFLLISLATISGPTTLAIAFVLYFALNSSIFLLFDLLVEHYSPQSSMGHIRGLYLTLTNTAWVLALGGTSVLLRDNPFTILYSIAAIAVLLTVLLLGRLGATFHNPRHQQFSLRQAGTILLRKNKFRNIFIASFMLQFFYAVMVIYSPLYLATFLSWHAIAIIFTCMLLPFVLLQYPLGKLCDRYHIEPVVLIAGFALMTVATIFFAFSTLSASAWFVGVVLVVSRIGASAAEVATESYFFKLVTDEDSAIVGIFRSTGPLAYIVGPIVGVLLAGSFTLLFVVLAVLLGFTTLYVRRLKDIN